MQRLENPQDSMMAHLTALLGSVFACLVLAISAAPSTYHAQSRWSCCSIRRWFEHASDTKTSCLSCSSHQDEPGLAPRRAGYSASSVSELSAMPGRCDSWRGFLIGSGELQDFVNLFPESTCKLTLTAPAYCSCAHLLYNGFLAADHKDDWQRLQRVFC